MKPARQPWHYNVYAGRPEWSKDLGRIRAMERQTENETRRRNERMGRK